MLCPVSDPVLPFAATLAGACCGVIYIRMCVCYMYSMYTVEVWPSIAQIRAYDLTFHQRMHTSNGQLTTTTLVQYHAVKV